MEKEITLKEYLAAESARNGLTHEAFAKKVGTSAAYIASLAAGRKNPGLDMMDRIYVASDKSVRHGSWSRVRR